MKISIYIIALLVFLFSCSEKAEPAPENYHQGEVTILTDESFRSVTEALADGYMIHYPNTQVKVETRKEDVGFMDLLQGKAKVAVMSCELSEEEIKEYERVTEDRKSTRLNSSHVKISYAVFCLKKKKKEINK